MTDRKEKKSDIELNYKRIAIVAIILVSVHLWGMFGGYEWISEISPIYRDMKIIMTEPPLSKQCQEVIEEFTKFKDFMNIGETLRPDDIKRMVWSDLPYYMELNTKIQELGCSS